MKNVDELVAEIEKFEKLIQLEKITLSNVIKEVKQTQQNCVKKIMNYEDDANRLGILKMKQKQKLDDVVNSMSKVSSPEKIMEQVYSGKYMSEIQKYRSELQKIQAELNGVKKKTPLFSNEIHKSKQKAPEKKAIELAKSDRKKRIIGQIRRRLS